MATLAEIRAKLKEQDTRANGAQNGGGDNAIYPFWNIPENTTSVIRFLPDGDASNTYFWRERQMIRIDFAGIKGQPDSRKVTVNVPCNEMWGPTGSCPVLSEVRGWFKDPNLEELGRKYWKKKSYVFQGFVTESSLQEESVPENPIRRFIINPSIFKIIKGALMDTDFENIPTDFEAGTDFRLTKSQKGQYADYSTSTWARRERSLDSNERAAVEKHGLFNLTDYLPKQPSDQELTAIHEMFEASVDGQLYDAERWGNFYRPGGVQLDTTNSAANSSPSKPPAQSVAQPAKRPAPAPVADMDEDDDIPFESAPKASAPVQKPSSNEVKPSAQDILAAIRARSSN